MLQTFNFLAAILGKRDEKGATATEYALIIAVIAVVIVGAMQAFGGQLAGFWGGLFGSLGV